MITLKATRKEFEVHDDSGYSFEVVAEHDPEWGWNAYVSMAEHGFKEADAALLALRAPLRHLLRLLDEAAEPPPID